MSFVNPNIQLAVQVLKAGGLIGLPTETVYGLGADAQNVLAVEKIYELKKRPKTHPLILHIADVKDLAIWAEEIPIQAYQLADIFWPGPLTLVLRRSKNTPKLITAQSDFVAIRIPSHPVALELLGEFEGAIVAPSANRFGKLSPTSTTHVRKQFPEGIDLILEGGTCEVGVESTILSLVGDHPVILRPGIISGEALGSVLGELVLSTNDTTKKVQVSGSLPSHYAPETPLKLLGLEELRSYFSESKNASKNIAFLTLSPMQAPKIRSLQIFEMPIDAKLYAHCLYETIYKVDTLDFEEIVVERPPEAPQWLAVIDRLTKASYKSGVIIPGEELLA